MSRSLAAAEVDRLLRTFVEEARSEDPPLEAAGCKLSISLHPSGGEPLARMLRTLSDCGARALVQGRGTRMGLGNASSGADVLLSMAGLSGIRELDAADGVVHVAAGTQVAALAQAVESEGWQLPLATPSSSASVGGVLATAASGPRSLGFGPARDCVLGLEVALASGERTRCGGRVVKNVTGYDLAKLYVGSFGSLGVIEAAWLRLCPTPRAVRHSVAELAPGPASLRLALEAARREGSRAVALVSSRLAAQLGPASAGRTARAGWLLVVEHAGEEPICERDAGWLAQTCAAAPAAADIVCAVERLQGFVPEAGLRARLAVLPSKLPACCEVLEQMGAQLLVYPVPGLVYACFEPGAEGGPGLEPALATLARTAREHAGHVLLEALPDALRPGRDVFGDAAGSLPLMRELKRRFDPAGGLNPGRFIGGL